LARKPDDPDCVVLAEQAINDNLRKEIEALRAALERIGKAIDEEAAKGRDEDWSLMWVTFSRVSEKWRWGANANHQRQGGSAGHRLSHPNYSVLGG
jgi:hypothetical protein